VFWTDVLQLTKTVVAVTLAWVLAEQAFHISQPFLAPWAALLTVHATVYRTMARGAQQVGAAVLGVVLAFAAGTAVGVNAFSLAGAVFLALLAGWSPVLRAESTTAAATALVVLTTGYSDDGGQLIGRLLDTGIGIGVGLIVTLTVWAPLRDRSAARHVDVIDDRIGAFLSEMAEGLRGSDEQEQLEAWIDRTRDLDHDINRAWAVVREARESGWMNPRPRARPRMRAADDFSTLLRRLEQAVAEMRSMARTIGHACDSGDEWAHHFREEWVALLSRTGDAVTGADGNGLTEVRRELDTFADELRDRAPEDQSWPVYGALIMNLRNIVEGMSSVADAQPVQVPRSVNI
jgi:uncharacterized membrane protein YgaE (UPF0421/DUF939 family)